MCFGSSSDTVQPVTPAEVLDQDAPTKKTANQSDSNSLAIGTKKYRTSTSGLGSTSTAQTTSSSIPSVSS